MKRSDNLEGDLSPEERRLKNLLIVAGHHLKEKFDGARSGEIQTQESPSTVKRWGALTVPIAFVLGKLKWLIVLLKFTKFTTLITMVIVVWVYAQIWGMRFALGFVILIYVHEMGHVIMMRKMGIKAGPPVFIPFVGAVISMKELPKNALIESLVAIGGPFLGTCGAGVCLLIAEYTGSQLWFAFASTGFMLNLFNMLPISPLDGGRITGVISRWFWLAGFGIGAAMFYKTQSPILLLILLFGLLSLFKSRGRVSEFYYTVSSSMRSSIALAYFTLLFVMVLGMWYADQPLKGLGRL